MFVINKRGDEMRSELYKDEECEKEMGCGW